jgi:type I restriction enzyme M protein
VILLPENLFYNTTAAGVIVVLNKRKPAARRGKIVLLNASKHFKKGKPKNYIAEEEIRPLAALYLKGEAVEGEALVISNQDAADKDYAIGPSFWIRRASEADTFDIPNAVKDLKTLSAAIVNSDQKLFSLLERAK